MVISIKGPQPPDFREFAGAVEASAVAAPRGPVVAFNSPRSRAGWRHPERCIKKAADRGVDQVAVAEFAIRPGRVARWGVVE